MPKTEMTNTSIKTNRTVTVYLFVALGVIVGTAALIAYLFNGK